MKGDGYQYNIIMGDGERRGRRGVVYVDVPYRV